MVQFLRLILIMVFGVATVSSFALSLGPTSNNEINDLYLGKFSEVYEDRSRSITLEELHHSQTKWSKLQNERFTPGFSSSAWWLRTHLQNDSPNTKLLFIDTGSALVDFLDINVIRENNVESVQTGDRRPFDTRSIPTRSIIEPIRLSAGESVWIYIRMESYDGLHEVITPRLTNLANKDKKLQNETLALGIYYGTLAAVLLYNLFLYVATRERGFRLYLLYVAAFLFWGFIFRGYAFQYLWPEWPALNNQILPIAAGVCYCTFGLFILEYLDVKRLAPRWLYYANIATIIIHLLTLLPAVLGYYALTFALSVPSGLLIIACSTYTGVALLRRGSRPARYFLLAFTFLSLGVVLYYLKLIGWVVANPITEYGVQVGSSLEVLLLAFGLADQMNTLKADKLKAEQESRVAQLALNTRLTIEVKKRTKELEHANQRLNELAITDELTQAYNRRHFNNLFEQSFANHLRLHTPFAMCMIDIDYFKLYNDTYGHQSGDEVLFKISKCMISKLRRSNDFLFRLGGEEFAILLSVDYSPIKCIPFVDSLRKAIENLAIPHSGNPSGIVTASFGLLILNQPTDMRQAIEVYVRTDELLYQAKSRGRNKVEYQSL